MSTRKVLVTGGAGYIGSHTVVELVNAGYNPVIVDNLSNSRRDILDQIAILIGRRPVIHEIDLCNFTAVQKLVENEHDIVAIIHFAAFKAVGESVEKPLLYY